MSVVIGIIVFIVGNLTGFFANRYLSSSNQEQQRLAKQATQSESALVQYKLNVAHPVGIVNIFVEGNSIRIWSTISLCKISFI